MPRLLSGLRIFRSTALGLALLFACPLKATPIPAQNANSALPGQFEAYLDGLLAAQFTDHKLAGVTVSVIYNNQPLLLKGYGHADLASRTPVDPQRHLFRPGSISKLFTWTAVMQLVEQGKLDLNGDISTYVPQFVLQNEFDTPLTLTHLMTHTPGLEDGALGFLFKDEREDLIGLAAALEKHMPQQVAQPGVYAAYSNWGTALAGLIVANVSGVSFEDYIQENIFTPLQMTQATFAEPLDEPLADGMSTGYLEKSLALEELGFEYIKDFGPAGALSASAGAITHFMQAHLNEGRFGDTAILQPETVKQMHSKLHSHDSKVAAMAHGFFERWHKGQRFIGHGGATLAFHSELLLDTSHGFGLFISFNSAPGAKAKAAVVDGVLDYFYPSEFLPQLPAQPLEGTAERSAQVMGAYRISRRSHSTLEKVQLLGGDVQVIANPEGGITVPIPNVGGQFIEVEPWVFQQIDGHSRLVFTRNDADEVTTLLFSNVPVMVGERLKWWQQANLHLTIIFLALIAAIHALINAIRNRSQSLKGPARWGRLCIALASACFLLFALSFAITAGTTELKDLLFNFPSSTLGIKLLFGVLGAAFTAASAVLVVPVWRSEECRGWARVRYVWMVFLFVALCLVLNFWNLLGWRY